MKLVAAAGDIRDVLTDGRPADTLTETHLLAALDAARRLGLPVRKEVHDLTVSQWGRGMPLLSTSCAHLLGELLQNAAGDASPSRRRCIEVLRRAATYATVPTSRPTTGPATATTTPLPSAAAAVALWLLKDPGAERAVRHAAGADTTLPGDYIAWRLGRSSDPTRAFKSGLLMLPASGVAAKRPVYSDNERAAGAMLLALSARTNEQKRLAIERITSRLVGGNLGGEDDLYTAGAFRCALLILGDESQRELVRELRGNREFPQRRLMTAMLAVGDRDTLDWLLFRSNLSDDDVAHLLTTRGIGEVLAECAPSLPRVDPNVGADLQHWQVRILRCYWGVQRERVKLGLK